MVLIKSYFFLLRQRKSYGLFASFFHLRQGLQRDEFLFLQKSTDMYILLTDLRNFLQLGEDLEKEHLQAEEIQRVFKEIPIFLKQLKSFCKIVRKKNKEIDIANSITVRELKTIRKLIRETESSLSIIKKTTSLFDADMDNEIEAYINEEPSIIREELNQLLSIYFKVKSEGLLELFKPGDNK